MGFYAVLFSFQMLTYFPDIFLLLVSSFNSRLNNILCMFCLLNLLKFVYGPECDLFGSMFYVPLKTFILQLSDELSV